MFPWSLSFPSFVSTRRDRDGTLLLEGFGEGWAVRGIDERVEQALRDGVSKPDLADLAKPEELAQLLFRVGQLESAGVLCRSVVLEGRRLATWVPLLPQARFEENPAMGPLSRFAFLRRRKTYSIVESPLRSSRVVLRDWRATAVLGAYPEDPGLLPVEETRAVLGLLANGGLMNGANDPPLWDFHSLLFHSRSRPGRSRGPHGMDDRGVPPEAEGQVGEPTVRLHRPSVDQLSRKDPPFVQVVENRRSAREHGSVPIDLEQLGEFLWRAGRDDSGRRPYPCAGGTYELEMSLAVHQCGGLDSGLYRYGPKSHALHKVPTLFLKELIDEAQHGCCADTTPQILIILSARFAKMTSKYRAIAYSNILKDVGVVFQTMALAACAMNLAGCPVGTGNSDLFCKAFGTEYATESSVGEFMLGSLKSR